MYANDIGRSHLTYVPNQMLPVKPCISEASEGLCCGQRVAAFGVLLRVRGVNVLNCNMNSCGTRENVSGLHYPVITLLGVSCTFQIVSVAAVKDISFGDEEVFLSTSTHLNTPRILSETSTGLFGNAHYASTSSGPHFLAMARAFPPHRPSCLPPHFPRTCSKVITQPS